MSEPEVAPGTVLLPEPGKLLYKSELVDVVVRSKHKNPGITRDRFVVAVEVVDPDPQVERIALLDIPEAVWREIKPGERCQARMYEQPNGQWTSKPPVTLP